MRRVVAGRQEEDLAFDPLTHHHFQFIALTMPLPLNPPSLPPLGA